MRAIRGAICAKNSQESILASTKELLEQMIIENALKIEDIVSVTFTCTKDLNAVYPAVAARELGLTDAALLCMQEMDVKGSMPELVRVMLLVDIAVAQADVKHVFLGRAKMLRPDLIK